jgi:Methyltransferase domain
MLDKALSIKGFMSEPELQWLAERASESNTIIEIGSYYGRSARALADNTDGKVYCIDPWPGVLLNTYGKVAISSGQYVFEQFKRNLADHIESGKVTYHRGTVRDFPRTFVEKADFVFIDGDHLFEPFRTDLEWAIQLVQSGIVSGHDYENVDWPAVKQLVDEHFPIIGRKGFIWWARK